MRLRPNQSGQDQAGLRGAGLFPARMCRAATAASIALAITCPIPAQAGMSTMEIVQQTIAAAPSCVKWHPTGVCFWLHCVYIKCSVKTSVRVAHYGPDLVVSSYHEPLQHPWSDWGLAVTGVMVRAADIEMGSVADSAGSRTGGDRTDIHHNFRDADAIGNPVAAVTSMVSGGSITTPTMIEIPGIGNLQGWMGSMGSISNQWQSVPASTQNNAAASFANVNQLTSKLSGMFGAISSTFSLLGSTSSMGGSGGGGGGGGGGGSGGGGNSYQGVSSQALGMSNGSGYFCPPAVTPFMPYFDSLLDAWTWRDEFPAELLYPASWIPGMRELGAFPLYTWGNIYPRDGHLTQVHPVKNAALLAQRIADIVSRPSQPHIYIRPQTNNGGFQYFDGDGPITEFDKHHQWQRLYPNAEHSCSQFGSNDTVALQSYGDNQGTVDDSYAFNLWRRYECCQRQGQVFLGSVAFAY